MNPHRLTTLLMLVSLIETAHGQALAVSNQGPRRPDILMIAVDDLRPMLGCYGDQRIRSPNIDRLARRGVLFERAYCQYAKCGPSRLSLMTGLRPDSIGLYGNAPNAAAEFRQTNPKIFSLARWLKKHGYHTQSFGKIYHDGWDSRADWSEPSSPGRPREMWEIVNDKNPLLPTLIAERLDCPVMQSPDVPDEHLFAGRMTGQVIQTMRERPANQPVFIAVGYRRPHLPFIAPRKYFKLYEPDSSWLAKNPDPARDSPVMAWFNSDGYVGSAKRVGLKLPIPPSRQQGVSWNGYELRSYLDVPNHGPINTATQFQILRAYAACISYVDTQIGLLLDELQNLKQLDNTLVILWSDHGWHLGEQSAWSKMTNFEIATRVPLIISGPGINPGRTHALAELVDLYPTLCELTDVDVPQHLQGNSLGPALRHPDRPRNWHALSQHQRVLDETYMGRAIRTDRYRFVAWTRTRDNQIVARELYDHQTDSLETINLANHPSHVERAALLESQLRNAFRKWPDAE